MNGDNKLKGKKLRKFRYICYRCRKNKVELTDFNEEVTGGITNVYRCSNCGRSFKTRKIGT